MIAARRRKPVFADLVTATGARGSITMRPPTLVLADDHLLFLEGLQQVLSRTHSIAGVCDNGADLVEKAMIWRPDIIISDISMPRMSGFKALRELRIRWPDVRMIFLTVHLDPVYRAEAVRSGTWPNDGIRRI